MTELDTIEFIAENVPLLRATSFSLHFLTSLLTICSFFLYAKTSPLTICYPSIFTCVSLLKTSCLFIFTFSLAADNNVFLFSLSPSLMINICLFIFTFSLAADKSSVFLSSLSPSLPIIICLFIYTWTSLLTICYPYILTCVSLLTTKSLFNFLVPRYWRSAVSISSLLTLYWRSAVSLSSLVHLYWQSALSSLVHQQCQQAATGLHTRRQCYILCSIAYDALKSCP